VEQRVVGQRRSIHDRQKAAGAAACQAQISGNFLNFSGLFFLVSISPTFYEQLLRQNPFAKKLQTQIVST